MMSANERQVLAMAFGSRILVLGLMLFWSILADPYDTSATLDPPCLTHPGIHELEKHGRWASKLGSFFERSVVWDGVYYTRIAKCGYEYEQTFAFLPALPLAMRFFSTTVLYKMVPLMGYRATLALSGYIINNASFLLAAICLYRLSLLVLNDEELAIRAVLLFSFNPASVFYSSIYSESLFALFSFSGMLCFVSGARWTAAFLFSFSSLVRSNGVLHGGFFIFQAMHEVCATTCHLKRPLVAGYTCLTLLVQTICVMAPFVAFQWYGYSQFCTRTLQEYFIQRPWCNSTVPYLYGFVQRHYWDVGFLRYFQVKQIPNFLSASPILLLSSVAIFAYAKQRPRVFFSIGLDRIQEQLKREKQNVLQEDLKSLKSSFSEIDQRGNVLIASLIQKEHNVPTLRRKENVYYPTNILSWQLPEKESSEGFYSTLSLVFVLQLAFMVLVAFFIMHVQVATRFLSSSPPLYWYMSHMEGSYSQKCRNCLWMAFLAYIFIGTLLFINFYPFT